MRNNKSETILPKSELQNTSTGRMGVERSLGLLSGPAPSFFLRATQRLKIKPFVRQGGKKR